MRAAEELARALGARSLLVFVRDAELDTLLPAAGFPQTIRGGPAFRELLRSCADAGIRRAKIDYPEAGTSALAYTISDGTTLIFLGGAPDPAEVADAARTLPLVGAILRAEHTARLATGEAEVARAVGQRSHDLTMALDAARCEIGRALEESARLNAQLQATDRRKDEFLAMLGHELRNPMAAIAGALEVMKLAASEGVQADKARHIVERQAQQLSRLVDDLLDVARITRGKIVLRLEALDLNAIAARAVETTRPLVDQKQHDLVVRKAEPLYAMVDPTRYEQMVTNLLINAAKYTDPRGHLELSLAREGSDAVLRVKDSGIGIAPSMLARVFEPFVQVDPSLDRADGGMGIGLTLVGRLAALHEGRVDATSEEGKGSEFVLRIPALPADYAMPSPETPARKPELRAKRVLVVDDNVDSAEMVSLLLSRWGHESMQAHDGLVAVEVATTFLPDVVILDIGLPGIDGYEVARRLREAEATRAARIIAVSGYGLEADREKSAAAGADSHLLKPVDFAVLRRAIEAD